MKAVDTTGAGDSFVGAFLTAVARDASIFEVFSPSFSHTRIRIIYHNIASAAEISVVGLIQWSRVLYS